MIGEIGSVKYYHSIIGKESFEKNERDQKRNNLWNVWYRILKNQTRKNTILIRSVSNFYHKNFDSDQNDCKKEKQNISVIW